MNIYFSGIGGVGIGPLAEIAKDAGYTVFGSDVSESLVTKELAEKGISISFSQDGQFLQQVHDETPLDWFVYTAALPTDHPELILARALGIKTAKRDELLAHIIAEKHLKLIAVAGTHGKTTTTGMLVWSMQQLGVPVSYSIGTTLSWGPSGTYDPSSEYFVYECDEFDHNFLHFHPYLAIVTNIDYDHPDTYPTLEDYQTAFAQFEQQSQMVIKDVDENPEVTLAGKHNRHNASLVLTTLQTLGVADDQLAAINSFPGTSRRFEKLGENLYSDYGHHPAEIAATLQMARELSDHVVLVYQPHQNVRQHEIKDQYTNDVFKDAEEIYWLSTYQSREDPNLPILSPQELTQNLAHVQVADLNDDLWNIVQKSRDEGKLVLCMGAGSIDKWIRDNVAIKGVANVIPIDKEGNFILQEREDKPTINNPGMVTGFGGAIENHESIRNAAARELGEETNLTFSVNDLEYLTDIFQEKVNDGQPRWVSYFVLKDQETENLEVYEGKGYKIVSPQEDLSEINLSPTVRKALEKLI